MKRSSNSWILKAAQQGNAQSTGQNPDFPNEAFSLDDAGPLPSVKASYADSEISEEIIWNNFFFAVIWEMKLIQPSIPSQGMGRRKEWKISPWPMIMKLRT